MNNPAFDHKAIVWRP